MSSNEQKLVEALQMQKRDQFISQIKSDIAWGKKVNLKMRTYRTPNSTELNLATHQMVTQSAS